MVEKKILKKNLFLQDLPEPMLDKIADIAEIKNAAPQSVLFERNQKLSHIFLLVSGTVLLTVPMEPEDPLILDKISAGRTFGISSLVEDSTCSFSAICEKECTVVKIPADKIHQFFLEDFEMGHVLMSQVVKLFRSRVERHTSQFLHALAHHDEIRQTLDR